MLPSHNIFFGVHGTTQISHFKRPREVPVPWREKVTVNLIEESSLDDAGPEKFNKQVKKCQMGHTFVARDESSECSFCSDLMKRYRDFANGKGGRLVSTSPDEIIFFGCHRRDHSIFPLKASVIRLSPGVWCPSCNPKARKFSFDNSSAVKFSGQSRDGEKRRMEARVEENRRDQARLLSSAKRLYKLTTTCASSQSSSPSSAVLDFIREQALADTTKYSEVSEVQCLLVRTILSCKERPEECWSLIASVLEQPGSCSREKLFRKAAREVHPDKCKHGECVEAFKALNALANQNLR